MDRQDLFNKAMGMGLGSLMPQLQPQPAGQMATGDAVKVDDIRKAAETVRKYKDGKSLLEK